MIKKKVPAMNSSQYMNNRIYNYIKLNDVIIYRETEREVGDRKRVR